jgi:hypothetical protein
MILAPNDGGIAGVPQPKPNPKESMKITNGSFELGFFLFEPISIDESRK